MSDVFLIVDGNSLMHRAFHALPLMDAGGVYTNAIHGFLGMLLRVVREEDVRYLAVCFDEHGPTFRHTAYADYKAGRAPTPPELKQQLATIRTLLDEMHIRRYGLQGWEADDLLGTLSRLGMEAGASPLLLTGDRDALQLVDGVTQLMFTRKGISETVRFTPETVLEQYGFTPAQVTDWKGLAGDSSDHIPGIAGIGDKTAVKLLQKYTTLENVLANAANEKGKLGERLAAGADMARMCKQLATIRRDAPVSFSLAECAVPDFRAAIPALEKLRLNQLVRRIGEAPAPETPAAPDTPELIAMQEEVCAKTTGDLSAWLDGISDRARPIALHFTDTGLSVCDGDGRLLRVSLGGDLLTPGLLPQEALSAIAPELCAHPAVAHDVKRLMHLLRRHDLPLPDSFAWDTMLGAYLLHSQEKSYDFAALRGDLPDDALGVMSLCRWQKQRVASDGMLELMLQVELPLAMVLWRMEDVGFRVDVPFLRRLGTEYEAEIEALRQQVWHACGREFNLNSTQQLGEVLFEHLQLPHGKKTSRGYSTSAEVLEGLRDIAPEVIEPLLRYRQLTKLQGTYIDGLQRLTEPGGRVHSHFDQTATATGRISSSEPNLQNIPVRTEEGREIRQAFLPREGWLLLDADYSQIELRLMAHFSGDSALLEAFRTGQDVHARTASEIFEVPLGEVTPTLRSRAKAVNFGLIYGISGFGLARNTGVTQSEARTFIDRYFAKYPGVKRYMDEAAAQGQQLGYAVTLMGRRRYLPELSSPNRNIREFGKRAAMNTPVQGTAADIIKLAMVRVDEALRREGLRSRLILQVHDELLLECPPEECERAAKLLQECMEGVISLDVPLLAEVHRGQNWAEAK